LTESDPRDRVPKGTPKKRAKGSSSLQGTFEQKKDVLSPMRKAERTKVSLWFYRLIPCKKWQSGRLTFFMKTWRKTC